MLFKYLPWDFVQQHPSALDSRQLGAYAFLVDEPYLERMVLDLIALKNAHFLHYSGSDVSREFIDEQFVNLSFFSSAENLMILNAETIQASVIEYFYQNISVNDRFVVFIFNKTPKYFNDFAKQKNIQAFHLQSPSPYQGKMLWQFCMKMKNVKYDFAVTDFALTHLEHNFESFMFLIDTIKQQFPDGKFKAEQLSSLIQRERWDYFEMVDMFHANPKHFFAEILAHELDFDWLREIASRFQVHIVKLLFPEEIKSGGKSPSKYNQKIIEMSERLDRMMLKRYLDLLIEVEIMAKQRNVLVINKLRLELLAL